MKENEQLINRVWLKCENCKATWYDDGNNTFSGCPECGGDFHIIDEEKINITEKGESHKQQ